MVTLSSIYDPEDDHQATYRNNEAIRKQRVPLLLFAGVSFVSLRELKEAGYPSRKCAQEVFFNRVRILYDFDTCTDRLSIIQSLLLMTIGTPTTPHNRKDARHWAGIAISLSYALGLNYNRGASNSLPHRKCIERRVWWTAFIRDRTLALNPEGSYHAGPVQINREDCHVQMVTLEDFEFELSDAEGMDDDMLNMRLRAEAVSFMEKAMLCWHCGDLPGAAPFQISATVP
ncbi:hypothetical protein F5884DRAFT_862806 [Xylogone sp. PMI_703]|nr:hypothetical protein F5884DRAFT_862806 [Xylogone sp. PMI_703]